MPLRGLYLFVDHPFLTLNRLPEAGNVLYSNGSIYLRPLEQDTSCYGLCISRFPDTPPQAN